MDGRQSESLLQHYASFLLTPTSGPDVCERCFNLTAGYRECYACAHVEPWLDHMAAVSYAVAGESLHRALYGYKRLNGPGAEAHRVGLAGILSHFLSAHEHCLAVATRVTRFELVTTVPSSDRLRDREHPLRAIVSRAPSLRERYSRVLLRSGRPLPHRVFDRGKYLARERLSGESVLLIDDTWTTGVNAQSAACALKQAGAGRVCCLVVGRHLNRTWHHNDQRLRELAGTFSWSRCVDCDGSPAAGSPEERLLSSLRQPRQLRPLRPQPGHAAPTPSGSRRAAA